MKAITQLHHTYKIPIASLCDALGVPRSTYYRRLSRQQAPPNPRPRPIPHRAMGSGERANVRAVLNSERFADQTPREIYATLLDEGIHLCHWRTMYRVLSEEDLVVERRQAARGEPLPAPSLVARAPLEVWSWDITKLRGPESGILYYLYVILDIFSRYMTGWTLARCESKQLAADLIEATCLKQGISPGQLTLHADRGPSMKSSTVAELLARLGVEKSHSRPRVSDDNPFSEAAFKTAKYVPDFPERFASLDSAWQFFDRFCTWYNNDHHHSGLALLTPAQVHWGQAEEVLAARDKVLSQAYDAHPERFVHGRPRAPRPPAIVGINVRAAAPSSKAGAIQTPGPNSLDATSFPHEGDAL